MIPYPLKIRSGCEGGGKGALIQEDLSATLSTNNDQYLFVPILCIKEQHLFENHSQDATPSGTNQAPAVCIQKRICFDAICSKVFCLQGNTIDRDAKQNGAGISADISHTINTVDRHAVAYRMRGYGDYVADETGSTIKSRDYKDCTDLIVFDKEVYNSGIGTTGGHYIKEGGSAPCLRTGCPPGVCIRYIVRRLTPTECARLQGFPDRWGDITPLDTDNADEIAFWRAVYRDDCERKGKKVSPTILTAPDRLSRWHAKLHSESAEYKIWGNGLALPCALYVMQGIAIFLKKG